jgi:hypothetical protein
MIPSHQSEYGPEEGWKHDFHSNSYVWDKSARNLQYLEIFKEEERPNVYLQVKNKTERFVPAIVDKWMEKITKTA